MKKDDLAIIALESIKDFSKNIDLYLQNWHESSGYLLEHKCIRFGTGEGKGTIAESVRGKDLYILVDVCNHSITYSLFGEQNRMSPDDHYQDLKRIIAACNGKPKKITVIMPFMYESRQHKRNGRESLDCATMLQELVNMGVEDFITFDAHDARVQNAIPLNSFETVTPNLQFLETLCKEIPDIKLVKDKTIFISPDEGAIHRSIYFANILGLDTGMFYKRRDYSQVVGGRNPIVSHEYMGADLNGMDAIVVDDMISSGDSIIDTCNELKNRGANRIFVFSTFGLFTNGMEKFDKAIEDGIITKILTTNLIYTKKEVLERPYYIPVRMEEYVAAIIDTLNKKQSIAALINPAQRIKNLSNLYR